MLSFLPSFELPYALRSAGDVAVLTLRIGAMMKVATAASKVGHPRIKDGARLRRPLSFILSPSSDF